MDKTKMMFLIGVSVFIYQEYQNRKTRQLLEYVGEGTRLLLEESIQDDFDESFVEIIEANDLDFE